MLLYRRLLFCIFLLANAMSVVAQNKFSLLPQPRFHPLHSLSHRASVQCSATVTEPKSNQEPPLIEPLLTLRTPPNSAAPTKYYTILKDPSMQSTWSHRAWVASGCTTVLISLAKSIAGAAESHSWLEPTLAALAGYILADLGSGIYHWAIDNYGSSSTPFVGAQIEAFQGHHKWPWTITKRQFANNIHALGKAVTLTVLPLDIALADPTMHGFISVCSFCIMFSQQFHAWSHGTASRLPLLVVALQDAGLLISRSEHAAHHRAPYNNNYCIVSGIWNEFLDRNKVFEAMEMVVFFKYGVRSRSWSEPASEWVEEIDPLS